MSTTVETTIEKESALDFTLADLQDTYASIKKTASTATQKLNQASPIKNIDAVQDIVASGMKEMQIFIEKSNQDAGSKVSKALSTIPWAGKFFDKAKNETQDKLNQNKTMDEIADTVIAQIEKQRETVMTYMEAIVDIRNTLAFNRDNYCSLLKKAEQYLPTTDPSAREHLDTKALITRLNKSLITLDSTINKDITTLLGSAQIAIQEIDSQLPDIEHDLKHNTSLATAQQSLANLMGMTKSVKKMTEAAGDAIKDSIEKTTIESIQMAGEIMTDSARLEALHKREQKHMENVHKELEKTKAKINQNFETTQQIALSYEKDKKAHHHALLDYTDTNSKG